MPTPLRPEVNGTLEAALYARDLVAAEAFYAGQLGLAVIGRVEGRHVFFRVGRSVLLVFNPEATRRPPAANARLPVPSHGATGAGHYCFAVTPAALDAWQQYLQQQQLLQLWPV